MRYSRFLRFWYSVNNLLQLSSKLSYILFYFFDKYILRVLMIFDIIHLPININVHCGFYKLVLYLKISNFLLHVNVMYYNFLMN